MSILGGIGGSMAADKLSKGYKAAGDQVAKIYGESNLNQVYNPGGAAAFTQQQNLLGLGDNAAGQEGFQNFLNSTGYQAALKGGGDAITSSMAASLGNKSGAADKARLRFGTGLANSYFDNYFNKLSGQADKGFNADKAVTGSIADARFKQYVGKGEAKSAGMNSLFGGIGGGVADFLTTGNPMDAIFGSTGGG